MRIPNRFLAFLSGAACVIIAAGALSPRLGSAADAGETTPLRVGVFDSRAVAIAHAHTSAFQKRVSDMKAEHRRAKEAGDDDLVAEMEKRGEDLQHLLHKQGFGTWPVDDILATIQDELPDVAREAGVDVIVSKWQVVYQRPDVVLVDITDFIVQPFEPDEEVLATIREMKHVDPVSLEELEEHHH